MAYDDIYKGLTEEEKEQMIRVDIPKFVCTGEMFERTVQQRESDYKKFEELLRADGVLKPDEHIIDGKVVRTDENGVIENENTN